MHTQISKGKCTDCHDSHDSKNEKLLKLEESKMCFECHQDKIAKKQIHPPAEEGCLDCHVSHSSDYASLLKSEEKELCKNVDCSMNCRKKEFSDLTCEELDTLMRQKTFSDGGVCLIREESLGGFGEIRKLCFYKIDVWENAFECLKKELKINMDNYCELKGVLNE